MNESGINALLNKGIPFDEFRLVFQPQFNINGEIVGAESLSRWQSKLLGEISPELFIKALEANNSIQRFDIFIFREALKTQSRLHKLLSKKVPKISVNVSGISLSTPDYLNYISTLPLANAKLALELTESAPFENSHTLEETFARVHKLGIDVCLDDFGTGYSPLNYLMNLEKGTVKIDRSFIKSIDHDPKKQKVVKALLKLTETCELCTIAEGVESQAELDCLIEFGVTVFQGYYFSRPLEYQQFADLLGTRH